MREYIKQGIGFTIGMVVTLTVFSSIKLVDVKFSKDTLKTESK